LKVAEEFYTDNGLPISKDPTWDYAGRYSTQKADADHQYYIRTGETTAKLNFRREPRFYASLGFDRGVFEGAGRPEGNSFYILGRQGEAGGMRATGEHVVTGYHLKKLVNTATAFTTGTNTFNQKLYSFPLIRLTDLFLLYAEALNETAVTSLNYPLYVISFKDLIYFPNVTELDLTGISYPLLTTTYSRNSYSTTVGGGDWVPFMRKFNAVSTVNAQVFLDLLASGQLTKVKYVPHSLGIDASLAPYITSGVVELTDLPDDVLVPHKFFMETYMQDPNFLADIVFPSTNYPTGTGLENVYKVTVIGKKSALIFNIPLRYQINLEEYKYLKFKMYAPPESAFDGEYNGSPYSPYQNLRVRVMNYLYGMDSGLYGEGVAQNAWNTSTVTLNATNYEQWVDVTLDFSSQTARNHKAFYIDIGQEAFGQDYVEETKRDLVFYFANIRFSKNP